MMNNQTQLKARDFVQVDSNALCTYEAQIINISNGFATIVTEGVTLNVKLNRLTYKGSSEIEMV